MSSITANYSDGIGKFDLSINGVSSYMSINDQKMTMDTSKLSKLDVLGYIPVVGTVSGAGRIAWGVVKAAFSALLALGAAIIGSKRNWSSHCGDGIKHIGRGFVELVPFVGGICTLMYDLTRFPKTITPPQQI